jgi:hypothetical protein
MGMMCSLINLDAKNMTATVEAVKQKKFIFN